MPIDQLLNDDSGPVTLLDLRTSGEAQIDVCGNRYVMHYHESPERPYSDDRPGDGPANPFAEEGREFQTLGEAKRYIDGIVLAHDVLRRARAIASPNKSVFTLKKEYDTLHDKLRALKEYHDVLQQNPRARPVIDVLPIPLHQVPAYIVQAFDKLEQEQ